MFLLQSRILYCVVNKLWNYLLENFVWHKFCLDRYMYKKVLYIIHSTYRYFFINQLQLVLIFVNVVNLVQLHLINTQISVCEDQGVWRSGCVKIRVCEEQGVWRPGCVKIRVCEDQCVWRSGCVKIRVCDQGVWRNPWLVCTPMGSKPIDVSLSWNWCVF